MIFTPRSEKYMEIWTLIARIQGWTQLRECRIGNTPNRYLAGIDPLARISPEEIRETCVPRWLGDHQAAMALVHVSDFEVSMVRTWPHRHQELWTVQMRPVRAEVPPFDFLDVPAVEDTLFPMAVGCAYLLATINHQDLLVDVFKYFIAKGAL